MTVQEIIKAVEDEAPPAYAASWDLSGIQVAGRQEETDKLAVALDPTPETVAAALDWGAGFILVHHPLALTPKLPRYLDQFHEILRRLMVADAWLYAAHTSLDARPDGAAAWFARALGLERTRLLAPDKSEAALEVRFAAAPPDPAKRKGGETFFADLADREGVLGLKHDGQAGEYLLACWTGAWNGLRSILERELGEGFKPFVRQLVEPVRESGYGLVGRLPEPLPWAEFAGRAMDLLGREFVSVIGTPPASVRKIAYCPGSGASLIRKAFRRDADVFLTGDVKYHQAQEAMTLGCVIDSGHFALEEGMMRELCARLDARLSPQGMEVAFFPGKDPYAALVRDQEPSGR